MKLRLMLCCHAGDDFMPQVQAIGNWTSCADSLAFAVIAYLHPESTRVGFLLSPALNDNARAERGVSQGIFNKISQRNLQQHRLTVHCQRGFCLHFDHVTSLPCSLRIVGGHGACKSSEINLLPSRLCTAPTRPCQGQQLVQYMARPQCVGADMRQCGALGRRLALASPYQGKLRDLQRQLDELLETRPDDDPEVVRLKDEIGILRAKIDAIPFIDTFDLRYNNRIKVPKPTTQAVMFCIMDVSGSMD